MGLSCPGGFIAVDVFFMISGFLITRIIRKNLNESTFSLVEFWERRLRRVFPALFVLIMGTLATG
jgi:peptidoglycan/LPS O-acetylase OafA/YrhL